MNYFYRASKLVSFGKKAIILGISLSSIQLFAAQAPAGYIEVSRDPEVPLKHIYDGITVLREITRRRHWQHPTNPGAPFADTVRAERDNPIEGHEERQVVYVVPIRAQNALVTRDQRNQYVGNYDFRTNLGEDQKIAFGPLFYRPPGTNAIYHVKVTQQRWERVDGTLVDFLVVSYKADEKLRFIDNATNEGALLLNNNLPEAGLYVLVSTEEGATHRWEKWQNLEKNAGCANLPEKIIQIRSPHGVLSIPGVGCFARNEKVAELHDEITEFIRAMNAADEEADAILPPGDPLRGALIITGPTKCGKTSFINSYAGKVSFSRKRNDGKGFELYYPEELDNFSVGYGADSQTDKPAFYFDAANNFYLVDTAGDEDTDGLKKEFANARKTYKMFQNQGGVKLLLMVDEARILTSDAWFIKILEDVVNMCTDDRILHQMIYLMISKKRDLEIKDYLKGLAGDPTANPPVSQNSQLNDKPRVASLIRFLLANPIRLSHFEIAPRVPPTAVVPFAPDLTEARASIMSGRFIDNRGDVKPKIRDMSHIFIEDLVKRLQSDMIHYLSTEGAQQIISYCLKLVEDHNSNVTELRTLLTQLVNRFKSIPVRTTPEKFLEVFDGFVGNADVPAIPKLFDAVKMREIVSHLRFLKANFPHAATCNIENWKNALSSASPHLNTIGKIEALAQKPVVTVSNDNNTITVKGLLVGCSDVEAEIAARNIAPTQIIIHAYNTWFIDQDMTHNSACMYAIASRGKVTPGNKVIDISGLRGGNGNAGGAGTHGADNVIATPGEDGKPGNPGKTAGSFFGKLFDHSNLASLTIKANGGQGGDGGLAGRGGNGKDAADGQEANMVQTSDSGWVEIIPWGDNPDQNSHGPWFNHRLYFNKTDRYKHVGDLAGWIGHHFEKQVWVFGHVKNFEHALLGDPGMDGGKGGKKGVGGNAGDIVIRGADAAHHENNQGAEGANAGAAGNGGQGGLNGQVLRGTKWTNCQLGKDKRDDFVIDQHPIDRWHVGPSLHNPAIARAANGNKPTNADGTDKISDTPAPAASARVIIDQAAEDSKVSDYRLEYREQAKDELKSIFVRVCPGLE